MSAISYRAQYIYLPAASQVIKIFFLHFDERESTKILYLPRVMASTLGDAYTPKSKIPEIAETKVRIVYSNSHVPYPVPLTKLFICICVGHIYVNEKA